MDGFRGEIDTAAAVVTANDREPPNGPLNRCRSRLGAREPPHTLDTITTRSPFLVLFRSPAHSLASSHGSSDLVPDFVSPVDRGWPLG